MSEREVSSAGRVKQRVGRRLDDRAVPAPVAELIPTLSERQLGSVAGRHHRHRVTLAESPLPRRQARYPVTDDAGAEGDDRREGAVREEEGVEVEHGRRDADPPRSWARVPPATTGAAPATVRQRSDQPHQQMQHCGPIEMPFGVCRLSLVYGTTY